LHSIDWRQATEATHDEVREVAKESLPEQNEDTADLQKFAGSGK